MFGRRGSAPTAPTSEESTSAATKDGLKPNGKGRPTPKRSEAQKGRKQRAQPPKDRREAYRQARADARAEREAQRQALLHGDEKGLPARDRGPVRRFVRDYVDSRRTIAEFFIVFAVLVLAASLTPWAVVKAVSFYAWTVMLVLLVVDSGVMALRLRKALRARFPEDQLKGAVGYGVLRSTQLRRLRLPKPVVKPGDHVD